MSLPYPENTVWYVEASSADGDDRTSGSAVAVWLQQVDKPATRRKYLLTCGHVVRGTVPGSTARDREAGFGPVLPKISAWGPDTGYALSQKVEATVADEIKPFAPGIVPAHERSNAANDWVLLRLESSQASFAAESVREFADPDSGELTVIGYPGGTDSFIQGKVIPTRSDDLTFRDRYQGVVRLNGTETRSGMSGGGLFDQRGALVGIHRSRLDTVLQCHSISMESIREQLDAAGYQLKSGPRRIRRMDRRVLLGGGAASVAAVAGFGLWWTTGPWWVRKRTPITIGIKQWVGYAPLVVAQKMNLCKDVDITFVTVEEIAEVPNFLLAKDIDAGMWLSATHPINRSNKVPARVVLKMDDSFFEDGIIARDWVDSAEDLVGKKVFFQRHDAGHCMLLALCKRDGVDIDDLTLEHVTPKDVPENFLNYPDVAAATTYEPHLSEANREGTKILGRAKDFAMGDFGIVDVLAVHKDYLEKHPEAIRSLIEGWYKAVELLKKSDPEAIRIACAFMGEEPTEDPVVFEKPMSEKALKEMIQDDHVKLAGRKENESFFSRDQYGMSPFRRQYENYLEVWSSQLGAGDREFDKADGSQEFLKKR